MKRLVSLLLAVFTVVSLSVTAVAGRQGWGYASNWNGKVTEVTESRGGAYLVMKEPGTAYYEYKLDDNDKAAYILVTAGNYQGRGTGTLRLECLDSGNNVIFTAGPVTIPDDGYYHRFEIGDKGKTAFFPEGTVSFRIAVTFEEGKNSPYFMVTIETSETSVYGLTLSDWTVSEEMSQVEVETTPLSMILSIGFVCGVALIMMLVAKVRNKYRKGKK